MPISLTRNGGGSSDERLLFAGVCFRTARLHSLWRHLKREIVRKENFRGGTLLSCRTDGAETMDRGGNVPP